ncbi:His Kinase A (phospho-acceptor) domain-containing protein [Pseudomonas sp. URIL14HWK12:I9]|nr:phospho-acceptor domain-containing protein [Pseudomonas sp. URIL14HWK12:I12]PVZ25656.1 phospho-acceptor domain-containing protein [Pseudomonas sp. URIL14HWK12:I10]PVZ36820.1 phospho-acceptor domain-containing protein [Pseudomonas sp. URIL14HWK12:I11]SNZ12548.1 His Kinase A (phospho-acceptor) domain-containing protein [Pseudomonas sp. URIL14HWK12:I9]
MDLLSSHLDPKKRLSPAYFLQNGGAVGQLLQGLDPARTPLGPLTAWSPGLKTLLATALPAQAQIVIFWGPEFVALYNDAYAPTIGAKHPHALGRPAIEYWAELWDDLHPLLQGVYETGETFTAKDRPFYIERHGAGETVWFDVSYSAVREPDGSVGGVLCIVTETTQRVLSEIRMRELNESLEARIAAALAEREATLAQLHEARKMEVVGQLTGGLAHDFNNLLTPIMTSLELIGRRSPDERSAHLVSCALQAAERARVLVGRLLSFARRQTLQPRAVMLQKLVADIHELIRRSLGTRMDVHVDIDPSLPAVWIDPQQLELAILNLAVNARDAMQGEGCLRITGSLAQVEDGEVSGLAAGTYARLKVIDSGSGMSQAVLEHCLDPFFTTKGVGKGTGLGLPMVQGLALQSGGGLSIATEEGQGTRISLWLPLSDRVL